MSSSEEETLQAVQKILDPYIRPREEVAHIRRVLALHLDSCLKDGSAAAPLALVESNQQKDSPTTRGLYKEYLEALGANIKARSEYQACVHNANKGTEEELRVTASHQSPLHNHLATIALQKKQERLQAVDQHLELLAKKPAASPSFLDPKEMFEYSKPLPEVPKEVVNSLTLDNTRPDTHLKDLIDQLEKHVLRTKLLLKREEQLLEQVKLRSSANPKTITESAKFDALNATRNELIAWIEAELGKASGDTQPSEEDHTSQNQNLISSTRRMDEKLASIKEKYTKYTDARKALLLLVSQQPKPIIKPQSQSTTSSSFQSPSSSSTTPSSQPPIATAHLLTPYLTQLLTISHHQKTLITQKSHISTTLSKQLKDTAQLLDHLADESQLIPSHPMPGRRKPASADSRFGGGLGGDSLDMISHVKPWVFAADSAKIATLEAVAEKIDEGQMALEGSMRTIGEIEALLGVGKTEDSLKEGEGGEDGNDDIWLDGGSKPSRRSTGGARKHVERGQGQGQGQNKGKTGADGDVWAQLDGNLGLLGGDSEPT